MTESDQSLAWSLLPVLERKAGRILANSWPTGVGVGHAMAHGGPYPATIGGRTRSVGSLAIERFLRQVCYQDIPDALLPPLLQASMGSPKPHDRSPPPLPAKGLVGALRMALRLVQLSDSDNLRRVAALEEGPARFVEGVETTLELALFALDEGLALAEAVRRKGLGGVVDLEAALMEGRVLAPIDHPDPAHMLLTGTGLTHLGSAESRDRMHAAAAASSITDSMRMFLMGVQGGKPVNGRPGVQPEWFYKGTGEAAVGAGQALQAPDFALDAGEEPEIAGIYVIAPDGTPARLGYCLANEFSDHVTEKENYLWLAHSKLRQAALGPELLTGPLPDHITGVSRILRAGKKLWERPFSSGEANMSHALANLEHHHFKYSGFRRPGDVHVHFFGTATLSHTDGISTQPGDIFEISAAPFSLPLANPVGRAPGVPVTIRAL